MANNLEEQVKATGKNAPEYGSKGPFTNDTPVEWTEENRKQFKDALDRVKGSFPLDVALYIGGRSVKTDRKIRSTDPNNPDRLVAVASAAGIAEVERAIAAAKAAFPAWSTTAPSHRSEYLFKAADVVRKKRYALAALLTYESGKNWTEALADTCESIDFLEYYGREMIRLENLNTLPSFPGETNRQLRVAKGVGAVIAPWNFALPISIGMSCAAIVTGNTVVYKPASQVPAVGKAVYDVFAEAGLPDGVFNFIPGSGGEIGDRLVTHPQVSFTIFTGSKEVGLGIIEKSGKTPEGAVNVKHVTAEMGGKNAIIVDGDADLDEAIPHIVRSAFSYMGQKCSACSRLIVLEEIYEEFISRFKNAVETLRLGPAEDPRTDVGAVIDETAGKKITAYIELGKKEATLLVSHTDGSLSGHFVPPTVFSDIRPDSRLAQEEIFGPVVCIMKVGTFEEALQVANGTQYALTAGVFSGSPANIEKACKNLETGTLYINRSTTGALMQRHPFGGYKMSGVGSKSMGPDYLPQFMFSRTIVENTLCGSPAPIGEE